MQEIRLALRALRRSPGFTIVALLTIALGIGVNVVMFSIANAVLIRPLQYARADHLLWLTTADPSRGITNLRVSYTRLAYLKDRSGTLDGIGAFVPFSVSLRTNGAPELVPAVIATHDLFDVLGVSVAAGRSFVPQEDRPGGSDVAVVTDAFWRSHLGGGTEAIGQPVEMNGRAVVVVGVLPRSFRFPFAQPEPQVWLPRVFEHPAFPPERVRSGAAYLNAIARVKSDQSVASATRELAALAKAYTVAFPGNADASGYVTEVASLQDSLVGPLRRTLVVLVTAAGFVLLIACVNVASLMIARASSRQREIALRRALGASNGRLLRSVLTESGLLALAGGALAVAVVVNAPAVMMQLPAGVLPRVDEVRIDSTVVTFAFALALLTAVGLGLAAATRTSGTRVSRVLDAGGRASTGARAGLARVGLVILEIGIACVLVSSAALLLKSVDKLTAVNPGFDPSHVLSFTVVLPLPRYPGVPQQARFYRQLVEDLAALPTVESAGANSYLPISGGTRLIYVCPQGRLCQGIGKDPVAAVRQITPAYFRTMRIPVVQGRAFDAHDDAGSQAVCIISEKAASEFFPGRDPIGQTILQSRGNISTVVVGVVGNVKALGLNGQVFPEFYVPQEQSSVPVPSMAIVIRSSDGFQALLPAVRSAVARLDGDLPLSDVHGLDEVVATSVAEPSLTATLTELFALLALVLAAIGIYGLMAYAVTQRRREIAVRMALGAMPADILALVFRQSGQLVMAGLGLGLAGSLAFGQLLRAILFEISPRDPAALAGVTAVIVAVSGAACYFPARRAMHVDPVAGLRGD